MAAWTFLTTHAIVLTFLAIHPLITGRDFSNLIEEVSGLWGSLGSPIKRQLSRQKSIPTVRGVSSSPSVVRIGVGKTNQ